jgi:hypothetical protein
MLKTGVPWGANPAWAVTKMSTVKITARTSSRPARPRHETVARGRFGRKFRAPTGVGFAQASNGMPAAKSWSSGMRTVPMGSMWTSGFKLTRPWR